MNDDRDEAVLLGGRFDGQRITVPAGTARWRIPIPPGPPSLAAVPASAMRMPMLETADYRQMVGIGGPARRDDGALVFVPEGEEGRALEAAAGCFVQVDLDGMGDGRVVITCRCGVLVVAKNLALAEEFQRRHAEDPKYGRGLHTFGR